MNERNPLALVALVIAFISAVAITAAIFVWRHPPSAEVAESRAVATTKTEPTEAPTPTPTPTTPPAPEPTVVPTVTPTVLSPRIITSSVAPDPSSPIPNAARTLARMRAGFRYCYNQGLGKDPSLQGTITMTLVISPAGEVTSATKKSGGINAEVDECLLRRAKSATFEATPSGGSINVPLTFAQAG